MYNFEAMALKALMAGQSEMIADLSPEYFTDKYVRLYTLCLEFFQDNKKLPSYSELSAIIDAKAPVTVKGAYQAILKNIDSIPEYVEPQVILSELRNLTTLRRVDEDIEALTMAAKDKDINQVQLLLNKLHSKVNLRGITVSDMSEAKNSEETHTIVRGFLDKESEDMFTGGGCSGLTIVTAASGAGKSIALLKAAINNYRDGKNVLLITLELPKSVMYARLISNISGVEFGRIIKKIVTPEEKALMDKAHDEFFNPENPNYFKIVDESINDAELVNLISVEAQLNGLDVCILDYIQLVEMSGTGDDWRGLSHLAKKLHKLTRMYDITVISAAQVNSEGKTKGSIVPNITTRGSRELEFSATQFFHLESEPETGGLIMYTKKNRIAECMHVVLEKDFAHMDIRSTGMALN
jgi:replicative DNA helicase